MSDSYLLQVTGQNENNENEVYLLQPRQMMEALPENALKAAIASPVRKEPPSVPQTEEDSSVVDTGDHELSPKTSEDSLDQISGRESPVMETPPIRASPVRASPRRKSLTHVSPVRMSPVKELPFLEKQLLTQGYPDTDSCLSVSPSPDPDSRKKTFDFSMIDTGGDGSNLSAALQMEQEFLDFMLSLPQIQKEEKAKEQQKVKKDPLVRPTRKVPPQQVLKQVPKHTSQSVPQQATKLPPKAEKKSIENASRSGLDHLDNLCRMMESLGELKEQNTRLQRRVQYLEELKALQEIHRDVQDSIDARKTALSLGSVSLSDSDLRLEDINKSCGYLLDSEESLDQSSSSSVAKSNSKNPRKEKLHSRCHSVGIEENDNEHPSSTHENNSNNINSNNSSNNANGKASSRWSRVKGVLKMERAPGLSEMPSLSNEKGQPWPPSSCAGETPSALSLLTANGMEASYSMAQPPSPSSSDSSNPSQILTEEYILNLYRMAIPSSESQMLELPSSSIHQQPHSSSEDDRRPKGDPQRAPDKEKKGHKSAWGKVKNMINYNSKRESVRKKSGRGVGGSSKVAPVLMKSFSVTSAKTCGQAAAAAEAIGGASDPEEYDLEYESMDPDGTSWEWEGDGEAGIWMGPKTNIAAEATEGPQTDPSLIPTRDNLLPVPKTKPQLTITLPSSENLQQAQTGNQINQKLPPDFKGPSQGIAQPKGDVKPTQELSTTPPSPRRSSNWSKVKQAFLTSPTPSQPPAQNIDHEVIVSPQHPPPPHHFQTPQHNQSHVQQRPASRYSDMPSSPKRKNPLKTTFSFDVGAIPGPEESDSPSGVSPEITPDDLILQSHHRPSSKGHSRGGPSNSSRHGSLPSSAVHKNLIDLQKTLTGEFSKKLQEWEKFRGLQGAYPGSIEVGRGVEPPKGLQQHSGDLPHEFKKKLHEWEKMKGREKEKHSRSGEGTRIHGHGGHTSHHLLPLYHHHHHHQQNIGQQNVKTKKHDEDDLPADFKKKLTEWEIRKALVGKGQQNVEQLQKNLGEEFNKKMAEWEKKKALGVQGKINSGLPHLSNGEPASPAIRSLQMAEGRRTPNVIRPPVTLREQQQHHQVRIGARISHLAAGTGAILPQNALDRKGSPHKIKKSKGTKAEKPPLAKTEGGQKNRGKELHWLEKELNKIDREKQRLEREKEKFLEREARLEKMRHAMRQGPPEKKEIYIKTSTGEFRFEGISQTFTKKLYEWEERRGIRPESSTFVLLDPNYKAPVKEEQSPSIHQSPETKRITRSRSESSLVEISQSGTMSGIIPNQSSISLNEMDKQDGASIQAENKAASEPLICQDEPSEASNSVVLGQIEALPQGQEPKQGKEEEQEDTTCPEEPPLHPKSEGKRSRKSSSAYDDDPYAPSEITRLIDSSGSDEASNQRHQQIDEDLTTPGATNERVMVTQPTLETDTDKLLESDGQMSEENYRSLLHENMTLLGKLKEQESLCRALETQMGDIDSKMDNVADQHLKTLEKLHRQVSMMKKTGSFPRMTKTKVEGDSSDEVDEAESNQRLIEQLKARIVELEMKGDKLMGEKEDLECAFKLHKDHETQIAESLLIRIRELQDAGAEVNIQTVQCQTDESLLPEESQENSDESKLEKEKSAHVGLSDSTAGSPPTAKKKRRKRRDEYSKSSDDDEAYEEDKEESDDETDVRRSDKEGKEQQKRKKKVPPKKVQKLHNLTGDLLFQAKRLEGALVAKHHLPSGAQERSDTSPSKMPTKRSLRGRSSLRLSKDDDKGVGQRKPPKGPGPSRTWSSIEAIVPPEDIEKPEDSSLWETRAAALASESQDLLAMNAELSRMARELRKEMMSVWSFRESTSESNSSDGREETIKAKIVLGDLGKLNGCEGQEMETDSSIKTEQKNHWLDDEAREVFDSIASLQPIDSEDSKNAVSISTEISDSDTRYKTPSPTFNSEGESAQNSVDDKSLKEFPNYINQPVIESEEHFLSWWDVPFPKKRKESLKPKEKDEQQEIKAEETYHDGVETPDFTDFELVIPGSSGTRLGDLLHNTMDEPCDEDFNEENETLCSLRLSPYYNITSPRASRVSRTSSTTSEEDKRERKDPLTPENDYDGSAYGTLKTNASSTFKSDILSSSFEYEDADKSSNCTRLSSPILDNNWLDSSALSYPPPKKSEFTPSQLHKVGQIIEETVLTMQEDKKKGGYQHGKEQMEGRNYECNLEQSHYETEVKAGSKMAQEEGGLRTRRVSDTQIEYEAELQRNNSFQQSLGDSDNIYVSKCPRPVTRIPSIRRNQSESDVTWLQEQQQSSQYLNSDSPSDIFVTTHRTIFTLSGEKDSIPTKVIPTFLQNNEASDRESNFNESQVESYSSNIGSLSYPSEQKRNDSSAITQERSLDFPSGENFMKETDSLTHSEEMQADSANVSQNSISIGSPPHPPTFLDALSSSYHVLNQPFQSKKKVLEVDNEASPTVKNMIDLYNQRITEKQELLINPFKPGDPFTGRKGLNSMSEDTFLTKEKKDAFSGKDDPKSKILKSQSTSIVQKRHMIDNLLIQKSSSGTTDLLNRRENFEPSSAPVRFSGYMPIPMTIVGHSDTSFSSSKADRPFTFDVSTDDVTGTSMESQSMLPQPSSEKYFVEKSRAVKIRKAKEEFLSRGATPTSPRKRLSGEYEYHSESSDTSHSIRGMSVPFSHSPQISSRDSRATSEASLPKGAEAKQLSVRKKESFRRQSEGVIYDDDTQKSVIKSASSGFIELRKKPPQGLPPSNKENRKSCVDGSDTKRSSKGILKLFKLSKGKERKDLGAVQRLCQHSLGVDIASDNQPMPGTSASVGEQLLPSTSSLPPNVAPPTSRDGSRSSRTLPRESQAESSASSSRSCPSSPVALRKSRTAQWLAKGKNIFKSRSPSPNKRPR